MINKVRQSALYILLLNLTLLSAVKGQAELNNLPYNIEIKKNFKNIETISLSKIGTELSYIPLETSPNCLIQEINKILLSKSYIFVNDTRKRILQFDNSGKYLRQIGSQGRGPEEYLYVYDFCLNEYTKEIYIFCYDKMIVFTYDGKFKKAIKLTFRVADVILLNKNSLMFHLPNVPGPNYFNAFSWIITDIEGSPKQKIKNNLIRVSQPGVAVSKTPIYIFDESAHFLEYGIDTLYYFKDNIKKPYSIFYLGDLKMDPDPLFTASNATKNEGLINKIWICSIKENAEYIFIEFLKGMSNVSLHAVYCKKTGKVTFLKESFFINDLDGVVGFWPKQIVNDNIMIDYVDAFDLILKKSISPTLKNKISESSNPIIVILK